MLDHACLQAAITAKGSLTGTISSRERLAGSICPKGILTGTVSTRGQLTGRVSPRCALSGTIVASGQLVGHISGVLIGESGPAEVVDGYILVLNDGTELRTVIVE